MELTDVNYEFDKMFSLNRDFALAVSEFEKSMILSHLHRFKGTNETHFNMAVFTEVFFMVVKDRYQEKHTKFIKSKCGEVHSEKRFKFIKKYSLQIGKFMLENEDALYPILLVELNKYKYYNSSTKMRSFATKYLITLLFNTLLDHRELCVGEIQELFKKEVRFGAYNDFIDKTKPFEKWFDKIQLQLEKYEEKKTYTEWEIQDFLSKSCMLFVWFQFDADGEIPYDTLEYFNEIYQEMVQLDLEKKGKKDLVILEKKWKNAFKFMESACEVLKKSSKTYRETSDCVKRFNVESEEEEETKEEEILWEGEEIVLKKGTF